MQIDFSVMSSRGLEDSAQGMRALQQFVTRPELGISGARLDEATEGGSKGFGLGALSVLFDASVLAPLADLLKAFLGRNRTLTLKFPTPNGEVAVSAENVSIDQLKELLQAAGQFSRRT
ncbi:hypothetical protein U7859_02125 [Bradyrhizobium ottawaense]|uniref:hypothetical protein n=1 Tax=Bradyrhizobium ottawaense TaxID=931866 RepID=UPI001BA6FBEA|nr:hypothetical protein [Bradyrhizobium ottawaense]MBR1335347.1 hypothetical protein [Bradyrhizobium ottawaense]WQN83300.1 hypothetical protein U7859_02125 [Bradyrhizobium ottawaense]